MRSARQLVKDLSAGDGKKDPSVRRYRSAAGMKSIISLAEFETSLHITDQDFDTDKNLLTVKNGVIDLPTGQMRRACPPAKAFPRSKYGEATVMRRLPLSILPAVERLLTRRLAEIEAGDPDVWESR